MAALDVYVVRLVRPPFWLFTTPVLAGIAPTLEGSTYQKGQGIKCTTVGLDYSDSGDACISLGYVLGFRACLRGLSPKVFEPFTFKKSNRHNCGGHCPVQHVKLRLGSIIQQES